GAGAGKGGRSPRRDRDLPGREAVPHRRDQRAADLAVERASPAIELRDDELVRAGAGDDLLAVDGLRDLDRPNRQRRIGGRGPVQLAGRCAGGPSFWDSVLSCCGKLRRAASDVAFWLAIRGVISVEIPRRCASRSRKLYCSAGGSSNRSSPSMTVMTFSGSF